MQSTKLLLVTAELPPQPGGIGNHAHHLAKTLCSHFFEVTIIADTRSNNSNVEHVFDAKQPYKVVRIKRKKPIAITYLDRFNTAQRLLKSHDILLVSGKFPIWLGGILSLFSNKKIYAVIHGTEVALSSGLQKNVTKWSLKRFNQLIAVSKFTKSLMVGWNLNNITVIPNGFTIERSLTLKRNNSAHPIRLVTVGNVTKRKGQHNVIQALPKLKAKYSEIQYDIVGIPTEKDSLLHLAKSLEVDEFVVFHGKVSEEDKIKLLSNASVFMMLSEPGLEGSVEGFGIAILEANALGVPAIGSKGCGIEDAISTGISGKLVEHDSTEAICDAVQEILTSYREYEIGAKEWSKNFSWDNIIRQYLKIIKK